MGKSVRVCRHLAGLDGLSERRWPFQMGGAKRLVYASDELLSDGRRERHPLSGLYRRNCFLSPINCRLDMFTTTKKTDLRRYSKQPSFTTWTIQGL